jgi:hypothetical protein
MDILSDRIFGDFKKEADLILGLVVDPPLRHAVHIKIAGQLMNACYDRVANHVHTTVLHHVHRP